MLSPWAVEGPHGDKKSRKWSLSSPSTAADLTMTERPQNHPYYCHLQRQISQWQKRPENGPYHRYLLRHTSWWQRPENGSFYCHLSWQTPQWQKDHATAICRRRPRGEKKDQKIVHTIAVFIVSYYCHLQWQTSQWQKRPENGLCHRYPLRHTSRWQKDQKMVHATAIRACRPHGHRKDQKMVHSTIICHGPLHDDRKSRKWSMPLPSAAADLTVTERLENGPCHHHQPRQTSWRQKDQKMVHATAICHSRPCSDKRPENGPCHRHPLRQTSQWKKDQKITGTLYLEAGINGHYFALTKTAVHCSCERLYELKTI